MRGDHELLRAAERLFRDDGNGSVGGTPSDPPA
jgi:hypothetical protein